MKIGGIMNLTLLDYPDKVACTIFTVGCNFRCPFCHNATLVNGNDGRLLTESEVMSFLRKRRNVLEGICLTGGEPLIQTGVADFLRQVKDLGYSVKLDTNGAYPEKLSNLVEQGLVDYVAMDVKNSRERYAETVGCSVDLQAINESVEYLKSNVVDYEFRTTVTGNLHDEASIQNMSLWLRGAQKWYLQKFVNSGDLIDESTIGCDDETLKKYLKIAEKAAHFASLRGV